MLHGRASMRPDDIAFTFTEYQHDPAGVRESLTWSQLSRRTLNMARQLRLLGSVGDRAAVVAPQGLEYIVGFLGAMQAGLIAVPLPLPYRGASHERIGAAFADAAPTLILTTAAVAADVGGYVDQARLGTAPKIVEVDRLDLDVDEASVAGTDDLPEIAYLQYSSGSTRAPTGVMVSHRNLTVNFEQLMRGYFEDTKLPPDVTMVSWLPFYHDMGLMLGVCAPILGGFRAELSSPVAFLEKPVRWLAALAENPHAWSSAPNFAFELAARKTTERDMAGLDLGGVLGIISGAERVDPATLQRFVDRFAHFGFHDRMIRPSYGLAEATVFVASGVWSESSPVARFDPEALSAGRVQHSPDGTGTALVSYRVPQSPAVRIVDADTGRQCEPEAVGEIWVHGDNVAHGYWRRAPAEQACFGVELADPAPGTPAGPWLRTGDLGFIAGAELFIVGRIKDLLIIRGRNHYPEDIEATISQISHGRVAAIAVGLDGTEQLVAIIEAKQPAAAGQPAPAGLDAMKSAITSAVSTGHGLTIGDLVLVAPGSIPTTTSGKIRRAACAEQYRLGRFDRLDG